MRPRCVCLLVSLAVCVATGARAQGDPGPPLSLRDALREALRANPELVALQRRYETTRAAIPEARFLDPPMFETQIWGWPVTTLNPARTDMYMFMAEQQLPGRGKRAAREAVANREADLSRQEIAVRANGILNEVKQAYADLILARATAGLYQRQTPLLEDTAETATLRYAAGHSGQHDTVRAVVELSRLAADTVQWRERAAIAATRLNTLLGRAPGLVVPQAVMTTATPPSAVDAERIALERHPEVAMASAVVIRDEAELARLRGERRPDFVIGGGYMLQPGGAGAWTARGGITWPDAPWARGRLTATIDVQERRVLAARAQRDAVISAVRRAVRESVVHLEAARERIHLLETAVIPHVEHALDVARTSYASDRGDFADLLDTERVLLSTRMELVAAQSDAERAVADLEMAIGDLQEDQ